MAHPLVLIITLLVLYPALYFIHLAMLNKSIEHFVGLDNFALHSDGPQYSQPTRYLTSLTSTAKPP